MIEFLRKIFAFTRPYRGRLALGIAFGLLYAVASAALMASTKMVTDLVFKEDLGKVVGERLKDLPPFVQGLAEWVENWASSLQGPQSTAGLLAVIAIVPAVMFVRVVCGYLNFYFLQWVAIRAVCDLRTKLFDRVQRLSAGFFHTTNTGELMSRISNDTYSVTKIFTGAVPVVVSAPSTVVVMVVYLLTQQPKLTLLALAVAPICVIPIVVYGKKVRRSSRQLQENFAGLTALMQEAFSGHRVVKAYNLEETMLGRFRASTAAFVGHYMRIMRAMELPGAMVEVMSAVGLAFVLGFVAIRSASGGDAITPGDFVSFSGTLALLYKPLKDLSRLPGQIEQARASTERVFQLMEMETDVAEPAQPRPVRAAGAEVRFENVTFHYGDQPALVEFDLALLPGQTVALVGRSGSGKTTAMSLLLRFYDPQQGRVTIGGTDLREFSTRDLREQIAVVTQDVVLFNDTIAANIALGKPGATQAEIEAAAKAAFAHDFIMEKPDGYATQVGERGTALSGGQRQRIAIARALIRNAPILLLDEATSALDTESERAVQQALEVLMKGRTTLCIAHRLSTIQNADRIVVMEAGRIVEQGRHEELVQKAGAYLRLQA